MVQLRRDYPKYQERDTEILVVGPEDAKAFTEYWTEHQMPFIGIPDPEHVIANLYSQQVKILKFGRMPAMAVIDKNGNIRLMHYADSAGDIPSDEQILALLDSINKDQVAAKT